MICHDARELFSARADDALSAAEQAELQAHLATCAECQREWARFEQTVALLRGVEPAHAPAGFVDRVMAARPRPWYSRLARGLFLPWPVKLPLEAAAILMVAGLAIMIVQRSPELQQASRLNDAPPPVAIPPEPAKAAPAESTTTSVTAPAPPSETMLSFQPEDARSKGRSAPQSREDARDTGVGARYGEQAQGAAEAKRDRAQSAAVERAKKVDASPAEARKEAPTLNEMPTGKMATVAPAQTPPPQASSPLSSATSTAPAGRPAVPGTTPSAPATPAPSPAPAPSAPATAQSAPAPARQPQLSAGEQGERSAALGLIRATDRLQARLAVADRAAAESTVRDLVTRAGGSVEVLPPALQPDANATVLTLLVPADRWDELRRGLEAVGTLRVTGQKVEETGQLLITLRLER